MSYVRLPRKVRGRLREVIGTGSNPRSKPFGALHPLLRVPAFGVLQDWDVGIGVLLKKRESVIVAVQFGAAGPASARQCARGQTLEQP